jgi:hypothetical protein
VTHNTVETPTGAGNSDYGGGIYSSGSLASLAMYESVVSYNTAKTPGYAPTTAGGSIVIYGGGTAILDRCVIRDNVALTEARGALFSQKLAEFGWWMVRQR